MAVVASLYVVFGLTAAITGASGISPRNKKLDDVLYLPRPFLTVTLG